MADFIRFTCPNGHAMKAPEAAPGRRMRCAVCKAVALVPDENEETSAQPKESRRETSNGEPKSRARTSSSVMYPICLGLMLLVTVGVGIWGLRSWNIANQLDSELAAKQRVLTTAIDQMESHKQSDNATKAAKQAVDDELRDTARKLQTTIQALDETVTKLKAAERKYADSKSGADPKDPKIPLDLAKELIGTWQGPTRIMGAESITAFRLFYPDGKYTEAIVVGQGAKASLFKVEGGKVVSFDGKRIVRDMGASIVVASFSKSEMTIAAVDGENFRFTRLSPNPDFLFDKK